MLINRMLLFLSIGMIFFVTLRLVRLRASSDIFQLAGWLFLLAGQVSKRDFLLCLGGVCFSTRFWFWWRQRMLVARWMQQFHEARTKPQPPTQTKPGPLWDREVDGP